ncbi:MAG: PDZ domain-containing protein, partial [Mycobacterium sp.]
MVIGDTTGIDLGASWFTAHYTTMAGLAAVVVVPLLLLGIIQSVYRQNASMLIRSVVVNVPMAVLLTAVAVKLVQLGLAVTDAMSATVAHGAGLDAGHFMASVTLVLAGPQAGQPGVPAFILFLGSLAVVCGAALVWIELLIRASAVYVAVLFLPLALASLAWPAIAHWCRRLVDTLVALILGKFVIVSVLSLAAGALAGGTGSTPTGAGGADRSGGGGGFGAVLAGAALLLGLGGRPARAAGDPTADGLALIQAEYRDLLNYFYKPLEPAALLQSGWQALQHSSAAKKTQVPPLTALPADADAAFAAFATQYREFAATLPKAGQARSYAYVVADGIAGSLHEQHTQFVPSAGFGFGDDGGREMEWGVGIHTTDHAPWVVTELAPDSQAKLAGLRPGDVIVALNSEPIADDAEQGFIDDAFDEQDQTLSVTLERD